MRCYCCNKNLSDYESRLRHPVTNEFLDICRKCLPDTGINPVEPEDMVDDIGYEEEELFIVDEEDDNGSY
jgi:hypothetical protein